jgi:multimeric flavodoxin WrbA
MASVLVLYHSQEYGNTRRMAEAIAEGAREVGADATCVNTDEQRYDPQSYRDVDVVAFGSPDYFGTIAGGLKVFLDDWYIARKVDRRGLEGKPFGLFFSHGGGGTVRGRLERFFGRMGTQIGETIESRGAPSDAVLAACRALGSDLAKQA